MLSFFYLVIIKNEKDFRSDITSIFFKKIIFSFFLQDYII